MTYAGDVGGVGWRGLPAVAVRGRDARRDMRHVAAIALVRASGAMRNFLRRVGVAELCERGAGVFGGGVGCWAGMGWYRERDGWDCAESVVGWLVSGRPDLTESSRSMAVLRVFAGLPCSPPAPRNMSRPPCVSAGHASAI